MPLVVPDIHLRSALELSLHAMPAMRDEAAALIAGLVFTAQRRPA